MTDVFCIGCGAKLGNTEDGYGGYKREGGLICWDCNMKEYNEEKEQIRQRAEAYQKLNNLEDIPISVILYCTQGNPSVRKDAYNQTYIKKIKLEDLPKYSTSCGDIPNHPFVPEVMNFLKLHSSSPFVVAELSLEEEYEDSIQNLAVRWKGSHSEMEENTYEFDGLVAINGGSLRAEASFDEGWDVYESE